MSEQPIGLFVPVEYHPLMQSARERGLTVDYAAGVGVTIMVTDIVSASVRAPVDHPSSRVTHPSEAGSWSIGFFNRDSETVDGSDVLRYETVRAIWHVLMQLVGQTGGDS